MEINKITNLLNLEHVKFLISIFKENNIEIIIFTTPYHKTFFDELPDHEKEKFENILQTFSNNYNIPLYFLHENYVELDIWFDHEHLSVNQNSQQYSDDIANLILDGLI